MVYTYVREKNELDENEYVIRNTLPDYEILLRIPGKLGTRLLREVLRELLDWPFD